MFKVISKKFPNAIYQYYPPYLNGQSYDVYIPDLNIAFEYQGYQHYNPVDFFGGTEQFLKQNALDKRKIQSSARNNIMLIEWKYDETITNSTLLQKLPEIHFDK